MGGSHNHDGNGENSGHVRIFEISGGSWIQLGGSIDGEEAYDNSGLVLSLSADGTTVAISSYFNDGNGENSGLVRVYKFDSTSWIQLGDDFDGEEAGYLLGASVSLSA